MSKLAALTLGFALAASLVGCKGEPDDTPWCSAAETGLPAAPSSELTYYKDAKPVLDRKCIRCHVEGGHAPFALVTYEDAFTARNLVRPAVVDRRMPPFLARSCCTPYFHDFSLTDDELGTLVGSIDQGGVPGDPAEAPPPEPPIGGLSRVDVTLKVPEPYTAAPAAGSTDNLRCFVLDWPLDKPGFVTGMDPKPGNRAIVHHMVIGAIAPGDTDEAVALDEADPGPGFDCSGGLGGLRDVTVLGGSLMGGDFPRGLGRRVEPGSKILLNVHYSTAKGPGSDQTSIDFRVDDTASDAKGIAIANPAWIIGDAMSIPAGEEDAVYYWRFEPTLFTGGKDVLLQGVTPHMHYFGSKIVVRALHDDGTTSCLLEIPKWDFGWEMPVWFAEPKPFGPDDELYIECHFDNSAGHQPNGQEPRDIAWGGNNQDMCAAFLAFTEAE